MKKFEFSLFAALIIFLHLFRISPVIALSGDSIQVTTHPIDISPRPFQVSFIPFFGTNGAQSGEFINNFSLNILAGYNGGTSGCEIGGLINIDRYDVSACQIAGIGNTVMGSATGMQCAGIYNIANKVTGTQIAGLVNLTSYASGLQIAGLVNQAPGGNCSQIGGLVNNSGEKSGIQIAGLVNRAKQNTGIQLAGLVNLSETPSGSQISGLINRTPYFKGVQIGVINLADSCKGVPIGVFSFIKNGYHKLELSADELLPANISFRSGVRSFYTILSAGIKPNTLINPLWSYGGGIGTSQMISKNTAIDFDFSFQHLVKSHHFYNNHLYKAYLGFDRKLYAKTSFSFGVTYNILVTDTYQSNYSNQFSDIAPYSLTNQNYSHFNLKSWVGLKIGLRFF